MLDLYELYYNRLINETNLGDDFNPIAVANRDWEELDVISKDDFEDYDIEDENDRRLLCKHRLIGV